LGFSAAIAAGLAGDGGLYVPATIPRLRQHEFSDAQSLGEVGPILLSPLLADDGLADRLPTLCTEAFNFPTPLRALDPDTFQLELFHGPTAAFKDVGARFLAASLQALPRSDERPLGIVVATSGDTGAAVASAFHGRPGLKVCVLYPEGRVSPRQAHQLGCFGDNVEAFAVRASFDDCQALAKQALSDASLQAVAPLSSANSISLGRWLPQMVYYAQASLIEWRRSGRRLNFVVPTGNLGNAMAAALARAMGLPIGRIVLACNANAVLPEFFAGADYAPRASAPTLANAMDVGAPSNFERLQWLEPDSANLRSAYQAFSASDAQIRSSILRVHAQFGLVVCPHTATAWHALELAGRKAGEAWAVVATAHPAKFEQVVEPLVGPVPVPSALEQLLKRPSRAESIPADYRLLRSKLAAG
jgi:threonine synthase